VTAITGLCDLLNGLPHGAVTGMSSPAILTDRYRERPVSPTGTLQPLAVSLASEQKCGVRCRLISLPPQQERDYSTY
jgi:hypothetical protein